MSDEISQPVAETSQPVAAAELIPDLMATMTPIRPVPVSYTMTDEDLDLDVRPEYLTATMLPGLRNTLNDGKTKSVMVIGPAGTGKTRQAWAMLRANRRRRCGYMVGSVQTFDDVAWPPKREEWVRNHVRPEFDQVLILSESNDILRHRFDREWIDQQACYPWWLVIDDVGFSITPSDWAIEAIYVLANERRSRGLPTLWTTNLEPDAIKQVYTPAIASRMLGGVVLRLGGVDRRAL